MSVESANVELLRAAYKRWNDEKAAGCQHWLDLLADDVKFGSLGAGRAGMEFTGSRSAKDEVCRYFDGLCSSWSMIHYTTDQFIAQGDAVAVRGRTAWTNKATGKTVDTPIASFLRLKDGKIVEFFEFFDTAALAAAATP